MKLDFIRLFVTSAFLCPHVLIAAGSDRDFDAPSPEHIFQNSCVQYSSKTRANDEKRIEELLNILYSRNNAEVDRENEELKALLHLDDLNFKYYKILREKYAATRSNTESVFRIYDPLIKADNAKSTVMIYPTETAPRELLKHLKIVEYADILAHRREFLDQAANVVLWIKKMQAGTGSSLTRKTYASRTLNIPLDKVKIGAKGTDLFIQVDDPTRPETRVMISIVEAQLLQTIIAFQKSELGGAVFHDIVSVETAASIQKIWNKPSLLDPSKTYRELVRDTPGLKYFGNTVQSYLPSLREDGSTSFDREAPGGHALFFIDAILAALDPKLRPETSEKTLIGYSSNGEDPSGAPDAVMLGWMKKNRAAIALVVTEKTSVDGKGGIMAIVDPRNTETPYLTVLETAEAKRVGQLKLYESLGGMASTNLTLFNYEVLVPKLETFVKTYGQKKLMEVIAPNLILNWKEQNDLDGVVRKYLQLEGAMGSSLMNLDRFWRLAYGEPLVHLIHVNRSHRTDFFAPIKSAFDFYMLFHSDRFFLDSKTIQLKNRRPGELPLISLKDGASGDKYYQDVENVLTAFQGVSLLQLDELTVDGKFQLNQLTLRGKVSLKNRAEDSVLDLPKLLRKLRPPYITKKEGQFILENVSVEVMAGNRLSVRPLR